MAMPPSRNGVGNGLLVGNGDPDLQPRVAGCLDTRGLQGVDQAPASASVHRCCLVDQGGHNGVAEEVGNGRLEQVAHPPRPGAETSLDRGNRVVVAGKDRHAEIGPETLGNAADQGPCGSLAGEWGEGDARHRTGMVVLDHQHVGMLRQRSGELVRSLVGDGGPGRVVRSRCDDGGSHAGVECSLERHRRDALAVDLHGNGHEAERRDDIEDRYVAGIFDADPITGSDVFDQHALDCVHGAGGERDGLGGDRIDLEPGAGGRCHLRRDHGRAVVGASAAQSERHGGPQIGKERGVGVARHGVDDALGQRVVHLRSSGDGCRHLGALATPADHDAPLS